MYDLVIVESPAKAKTIEGYLGSGYRVVSSVGHVLDLATSGPGGLGIDVENNFEPTYKVISDKKKVINEIKKLAKDAEKVYIATDPDREGEAIGWHLCLQLDLDVEDEIRISFPEITKEAIEKGIKEAHFLDMNLVHSQETRRMIDRIMGFKLSKLLQKKIKVKSAGRVQSVALQMIVERENEIRKFVPDEYWKLFAQVDGLQLDYKDNDKKVSKEIIEDLYNLSNKTNCLRVDEIKIKNKKQTSRLPYTTSTFQQDAINRLGFSSRRAMSMAQKLYEGIEVDGKLEGLITYMRTDSMRLSPGFITQTKGYIESEYGPEYIGNYKIGKKKGNVQDAHEAIRPSNVFNTPSKVKAFLTTEQFKIYQLIWNRTVASLMADAILETSSYLFTNNEKVPFKAANTKVLFDGYQKVFYEEEKEANYEIKYVVDEVIKVKAYEKTQHFTQPKPRYTEAKLIKKLEENGVGRPSTYSSIIETLKKRMYVAMESKKFVPTEDGELVTTKLKEFFSTIVNVDYTSQMEANLDLIANGEEQQINMLDTFYHDFNDLITIAYDEMPTIEAEQTGEMCPLCDHPLVLRKGKFGMFVACSNFPKCKYIKQDKENQFGNCPKCNEGTVVGKMTKRGKKFYACDSFPKCDFAVWELEELEKVKKNKQDLDN